MQTPSSSSDAAAIVTEIVRIQVEKRDAEGNLLERVILDGDGNPVEPDHVAD